MAITLASAEKFNAVELHGKSFSKLVLNNSLATVETTLEQFEAETLPSP